MLHALLSSVPDRTDLEVIVVDDRSPLPVVIQAPFKRTKLTEITNEPGLRFAGTARNTGVARARGRFVLFADSDDLFDPEALDCVLESISDNDHDDVIYFRTKTFGYGPDRHVASNVLLDRIQAGERLSALSWYCTPVAAAYRRSFLLRNHLIFPEMRISEDMVFTARVAATRPRVSILPHEAYLVRSHDSLTSRRDAAQARDVIRAQRMANRILMEAGLPEATLSMLRPITRYARAAPLTCLLEVATSLWKGERLLPSKAGQAVPSRRTT